MQVTESLVSSSNPMHQNAEVEEEKTWTQDLFQIRPSNIKSGSKNNSRTLIILLFILGASAGLINGSIMWTDSLLTLAQVKIIELDVNNSGIGLFYFILSTGSCVFVSAFVCKYFSKQAAGSGLPEFKSLLASEMKETEHEKLVSLRIFCVKVVGLVLSIGSSLSIGSEGPLVHTAACIAHIWMKYVSEFADILESPSLSKQIYAASAAIGVSSAFNAPVGGLLFSIEVTSTFYLVSNYWKSFIAAVAGSVACNIFLLSKGATSDVLVVLNMAINPHPFAKWELILFLLIGIGFGYLAHAYLWLHQQLNIRLRPFNKNYPIATATSVAVFTSIIVYATGAYSSTSVGVITNVSDVLTTGHITEMKRFPGVSRLGGLFTSFLTRASLTLLGTNIAVPAGIFMPVFLIGGILGRFIGLIVMFAMGSHGGSIDVPAYALVGATAFASGVTHTISVAVIAVELTGNIHMLLPCLLVAVVAAGITKAHGLSVYDQGMLNKGLESFQLLLMEVGGQKHAGDIMERSMSAVPTTCQISDLLQVLEATTESQSIYPIIEMSEKGQKKLVGTVGRAEIFLFLQGRFEAAGLYSVLKVLLPQDAENCERKKARKIAKIANKRRRDQFVSSVTSTVASTIAVLTDERLLFGDDEASNTRGKSNDDSRVGETVVNALHDSTPVVSDIKSPLAATTTSEQRAPRTELIPLVSPLSSSAHSLCGAAKNDSVVVDIMNDDGHAGRNEYIAAAESELTIESEGAVAAQGRGRYSRIVNADDDINIALDREAVGTVGPMDGTGLAGTAAAAAIRAPASPFLPIESPATIESEAFSPNSLTLSSPAGLVSSPGGTVSSPGGTVSSPGGTVSSPGGTVSSPVGTVSSPGGTVLANSQHVWDLVNSMGHAVYGGVEALGSSAATVASSVGAGVVKVSAGSLGSGLFGSGSVGGEAVSATSAYNDTTAVGGGDEEAEYDHHLKDILAQDVAMLGTAHLAVNLFPFSVAERTPMEQVYVLFEMVKVSSVFVLEDGDLIGMITRDTLVRTLRPKEKTA